MVSLTTQGIDESYVRTALPLTSSMKYDSDGCQSRRGRPPGNSNCAQRQLLKYADASTSQKRPQSCKPIQCDRNQVPIVPILARDGIHIITI